MTLEILWFCLLAFFWTAYFVLEGFDFGVGMLLPGARPKRGRPQHDVRVDRPALGRKRGLARDRRGRDLRGLPGVVRDDVLRLLPRPAAHPRPPDRPRALVRVARKGTRSCVEGVLGVDEHDRVDRRAVRVGRRARQPSARHPDRVRPDLRGRLRRSLQRLQHRRGDRRLPALRAPRRGLPHACARSATSASAPGARRRGSRRWPRSSARASSSGRSSSPAT